MTQTKREKIEQWFKDNYDLESYGEEDTFKMVSFIENFVDQLPNAIPCDKMAFINWSTAHNKWRVLLDSGKEEVFVFGIVCEGHSQTTTYKDSNGHLKMAMGCYYNYSRMEGATTLRLHI